MLKLTRPLASIDLETTGFSKNDRIVQVGVIKLHPDGREKEWETLVNPEIPIPPHTTEVHGITDDMVKDALPWDAVGKMLRQGLDGCDLCGYNIPFDIRILKQEYQRIGSPWSPTGKVVDGLKIFMHKSPRDLKSAVKYFLNREHEGAHTALADARAALEVLQAQLERYDDLPQTVDELHYLFFEKVEPGFLDPTKKLAWRDEHVVLNFGKHGGKPLGMVPKDYLEWMLEAEFSTKVKEIIRQALGGKYPSKE